MPALNLRLPRARIDAQSKECQKRHWKASHKEICPDNVIVNQKHGETPEHKAYYKKMRRYMNAWTPAITYCLPMALDLANHEWGRHNTHLYVLSAVGSEFVFSNSNPNISLLIRVEHTGLDADHELYRVCEFHVAQRARTKSDSYCRSILPQVKDAIIKTYTDMLEVSPDLKNAAVNPPRPGLSHFRCFFFFTYEDHPEFVHTRSRIWWMENIREVYYNMDKEYSRVNSMLALPRLVTEMNILRDPQQAVERFRLISLCPGLPGTPTEEAEKDSEKPLT